MTYNWWMRIAIGIGGIAFGVIRYATQGDTAVSAGMALIGVGYLASGTYKYRSTPSEGPTDD